MPTVLSFVQFSVTHSSGVWSSDLS